MLFWVVVVRFSVGVFMLGVLACGSSGSHESGGPGAAGTANGGSAGRGGSGVVAGAGGFGVMAGAGGSTPGPVLPAECRPEPAAVTSPGSNPWLEFIPTWVETICANIGGCCDGATFDAEGCRRHYSGMTSVLANGDPNHYAYDPASAEACLEQIRSELGACTNGFGGSCTRVMRGLLRDGESCTNHRDCVSGTCSDTGSGSQCGRGPRAVLDAPCALSCSLDSYGAWSCWGQPSQADIGQCFAEDGLFCSLNGEALGPLDGSGATCQPLRATGEDCADPRECSDGFCTSGVCGPDPGSELGADCPCKVGLHCVEGTCQSGGNFGDACDFANSPCAAGLDCTAGTCQCGGYYGSYIMPIVCSYD